MSNICFIPARSSSTRLKKKNVARFGKGNLVTHTIEQALSSEIFDRIILSSNSESILNIGMEFHIDLHLRDDKEDQIIGVMRNAIPLLGIENKDTIGLLLVTNPLRSTIDIQKAHEIFLNHNKKHSVVSVKRNENPIQMAFKIDDGHLNPVMPNEYDRSTRKQDHYDTFFYNDAIIFDLAKRFMKPGRNLFGKNPIPYIMPWERSIAIDYEFQLRIARSLRRTNEI